MQTEVLDNPLHGSAGDMADHYTATNGDIVSRKSEETTAGVLPGLMVAEGAADGGCALLTANTDVLCGIATRAHFSKDVDVEYGSGDFPAQGAAPGVALGIGRTGRYFVIIEETVVKTDQVHVRAVVNGNANLTGAFRKQKDTNKTIDVSDFCKWAEGGEVDGDTGYGVAVLEVNMGLAPLATADS